MQRNVVKDRIVLNTMDVLENVLFSSKQIDHGFEALVLTAAFVGLAQRSLSKTSRSPISRSL